MKSKDILIIIGLFVWICIMGAIFGDHSQPVTATDAEPTIQKQVTFQEQITKEIKDDDSWHGSLDSYDVQYNNLTKALMIDMVEREPGTAHNFRNIMTYNTMEILNIANKYPDEIDNVFLTGYTDMMNQQGQVSTDKVYFVQVSMSKSSQVNWKNLEGSKDMVQAIQVNVDSMWLHPGVTG